MDNNGNKINKEYENYRYKISYIDAIKSFIKRDSYSYKIMYNNDEEYIVIMNSYNSAMHPIIRYCDRTILM